MWSAGSTRLIESTVEPYGSMCESKGYRYASATHFQILQPIENKRRFISVNTKSVIFYAYFFMANQEEPTSSGETFPLGHINRQIVAFCCLMSKVCLLLKCPYPVST